MASATRQRTPPKKSTAGIKAAAARREKEKAQRRQVRVERLRRGLGRGDVWGAVLVVVGVLVALGTWADLTGPFGRVVDGALADLAGVARFALPPAVVWVGVSLVRGRPSGATARVCAGLGLLLVAGNGLAHLVGDGTGGGIGRTAAEPLRALLSPWGAGVVLAAVAAAAGLVLTATTVRAAAEHLSSGGTRVVAGSRPVLDKCRDGMRWFTTLPPANPAGGTDPAFTAPGAAASPVLFDVAAVDDAEMEVTGPLTPSPPAPVPDADPDAALEQLAIDLGPAAERSPWKLPPLSLLERSPVQEVDRRLVEQAGRTLEHALAEHGVETRLVGMTVGPTVTRYELELGPGVKVARVTSLHRDIAYAMASPDVRILAPIPGRSAIGVEVPNQQRQLVAVGDILASEEARRATHPCEVAVGRDISGRAVLANLAEMPHLLIAGATGAGKSSCINSLLTSVLVRSTPEQVRLILVDPKRVELGQYNGLPHLLTPVVISPKKAANALAWAVKEMERRYDLLSEVGVRDITGYNGAFDRGELRSEARAEGVDDPGETLHTRLPFVIIVVDELNDLMMVAARDVEESICRIAQMARAVGIHLVIATQRPSVNVITGVIKANVPARLAFAVSSLADSRVILDQAGAERLVGQGDMLLLGAASSTPRRIQGAWVGEDEVHKVVAHWRRQAPSVVYTSGVEGDDALLGAGTDGASGASDDDDELCRAAMELIVRSQLGSTSMLQRKLRVGFARAGRVMDLLEQRGVVGPSTGSKARDVLMTAEELDELSADA
ncbi:MAG: DNA translocase FtsK [Acidimicrobiales bacterium]